MSEPEIPDEILRKHPELVPVGQALAQHRRGQQITATCPKCSQILEVTEVDATKTTVVACPSGHTLYRSKHEPRPGSDAPILVSADEALKHGLAAVTVRCDASAAGMYSRPFPMKDVLVALNGPPGGPLVVMIWDCTGLPIEDLESIVRAKLVDLAARPLEIIGPDRGYVLGHEQSGLRFRTGAGRMRIVWFAFIVERPGGTVMVGLGTSGQSDPPADATAILSNTAIKAAVGTLALE
jgi:hypothetical protein